MAVGTTTRGAERFLVFAARAGRTAAGLVLAIGVADFALLLAGQPAMAALAPLLGAVKSESAAAIFLLGVGLMLVPGREAARHRLLGVALTGLVFALTLAILAERATGIDVGIDTLAGLRNGRMSPLTACGFALAAAGTLLLYRRSSVATGVAAWLACVSGFVAALALGASFLADGAVWRASLLAQVAHISALALGMASISILLAAVARYGAYHADRHFLYRRLYLFAFLFAFLVVSLAAWAMSAYIGYIGVVNTIEANAVSTARLLEEHTTRTLDAGYLLLDHVSDSVEGMGLPRLVADHGEWQKIARMTARTPQIVSVFIVDAEGRLVLDSDSFPPPPAPQLVDREYFQVPRDTNLTNFIGPSFIGRLTGRRLFTISRRLTDADGRFAGVVIANVDIAYFKNFYESLHYPASSIIAITRENGQILVRYPWDEKSADLDLSAVEPYRSLLKQSPVGTFVSTSPIDGVQRFLAYRRMSGLPLVAVAGMAIDEAGTRWAEREVRNTPLLVGIFVLLAVVAWWGVRGIHREEEVRHQLESLATTDPLTGINNRRAFLDIAGREIARARRFGTPLSLIMVDADHFKRVNDTYGHAVGDRVLKALANACKSQLRDVDVVARIGGEEFAILLPETALAGAANVGEKMRETCENTIVLIAGGRVRFTVSLGISALDHGIGDIETLLKRADEALYRAKQAGRNRVVSAA